MLDIQAAVGRVQLGKVTQWNARRAAIARALYAGLAAVDGLVLPDVEGHSEGGVIVHAWHVFHVFVTDLFPLPKEQFMYTPPPPPIAFLISSLLYHVGASERIWHQSLEPLQPNAPGNVFPQQASG